MAVNKLDRFGEEALYAALRNCWHAVAYADELIDRPLPVTLLDEPIVIVRLGRSVAAFRDICVHRGTALSLGWVDADLLVCAYHGWSYDQAGICRRIPSQDVPAIPRKARLVRYAAVEQSGLIWVCLGDPILPAPVFTDWDQPGFRMVKIPAYDWASSAARRVENFVDISHFPWVHEGILGTRDDPVTPEQDVVRDETSLSFQLSMETPPTAIKENITVSQTEYRLFLPFTVLLRAVSSGDRVFSLFLAASPVSAKRTRSFTWNARNYLIDPLNDAQFEDFQELVLTQDRPIVESQRPEELPIDLSEELHVRGADRIAIEYRRWLLALAQSWSSRSA